MEKSLPVSYPINLCARFTFIGALPQGIEAQPGKHMRVITQR